MIRPAELAGRAWAAGVHRHWLAVGESWFGPTRLPLVVVQGATPGPRLVVVAAQHGDEGYAVLGAHRVAETLDPTALRGSVWLIPVLNVHAYAAGHRVSPFDHHDMNRVHPGNPAGTVTEQIADALARHVLPGADLLVDLHGGSPENGDVAFGRWADAPGAPSVEPLLRSLALDFVLAPGGKDLPGMLSGATRDLGVPQLSIEACNAYGRSTDNAAEMAGFVFDVLRARGQLPGGAPARRVARTCGTASHRAATGGAWESFVTFGQRVEAGTTLGVVRNLLGERVQTVLASATGTVAVMRTGTRIHPGETVCTLAVDVGA